MNDANSILSTQALIGAPIINSSGKKVGHLEELMVDTESGTVAYAVLFLGNLLGSSNKHFAMPWQGLLIESDSESILLTIKIKPEITNK